MSLRTDLVTDLTALMAATDGLTDIRVVPSVRAVGELSKPVLIVKTNALAKLPEAPRTKFRGDFTLTLVSPHQDIDSAEDDLEARLEILLPKLFTRGYSWQSADQASYDESRICYDIALTSIYQITEG